VAARRRLAALAAACLACAALAAGCRSGVAPRAPDPTEAGATPAAAAAGERVEHVAPGLVHRSLRRGEPAAAERYRVIVGAHERQREADELLARLEGWGETPAVSFRDHAYEISLAGFVDRAAAASAAARLRRRGVDGPLALAAYGADLLHPSGPWAIEVLEADPARMRLEVAHGYDAAFGVETTAQLARRRGALAAVNGGFYLVGGLLPGDAQGVLAIDGELLSEPDRNRGAIGLYEEDGRTRALFGRLRLAARLAVAGRSPLEISGINRRRGADEVVLYTPRFHRTTLTDPSGSEVAVEGGRISAVRRLAGSSAIPAGGFVVSFGARAEARAKGLEPGAAARLEAPLEATLGDPSERWARAVGIASAGPLLLWRGERLETHSEESISRVFALARHPRTAAAVREDGSLLLVTVDGRSGQRSVGMSLRELTDLLLALGAVSALNLDGGGSTTMVIAGRLANAPSDPEGERAVGDALLVYPRREKGED
jgi:hypothetical protein